MKERILAWNGIRLRVPDDYEEIVHGPYHISIESDFKPVLELRWERQHAGDPRQQLTRIRASCMEQDRNLSSCAHPPFAASVFSAEGEVAWLESSSIDAPFLVIRQCRHCHTTLLGQLFVQSERQKEFAAALLDSFTCHDDASKSLWAIQDFRLTLPKTYRLSGSNFAAGYTRLAFEAGPIHLETCRLATAAERLKGRDLAELLQALHPNLQESSLHWNTAGNQLWSWTEPSLARQIVNRIRRQKPFCHGTIRHYPEADRILAMICESSRPIDQQEFSTIFATYEIV